MKTKKEYIERYLTKEQASQLAPTMIDLFYANYKLGVIDGKLEVINKAINKLQK